MWLLPWRINKSAIRAAWLPGFFYIPPIELLQIKERALQGSIEAHRPGREMFVFPFGEYVLQCAGRCGHRPLQQM